jgi:hypothetical protein
LHTGSPRQLSANRRTGHRMREGKNTEKIMRKSELTLYKLKNTQKNNTPLTPTE